MARRFLTLRGRQGNQIQNLLYVIPGLLVIVVVIALLYGRHPSGENEVPADVLTETDVESEIVQGPVKLAAETVPKPDLSANVATPTMPSDHKVARIIAEAIELINEKPSRVIEARDKLNDALLMPMDEQQRVVVKNQLSQLSRRWLFSMTVYPTDSLCDTYEVKPGDQLRMIGERLKVPYEILMQINNINRPEALQAGTIIKVIKGPFNAKIYCSSFTMDLYLQNVYVRSFPVGLGKPGHETPAGLWRVKPGGKLISPTWTDPDTSRTYKADDPDYPLGSRWIALEGIKGEAKSRTGFAIHGTKEPNQIGAAGSRGCIRLHNGDAILVYNLLMPAYSLVETVE